MSGRDERIYEEAAALWRALHGDAAPAPPDPRTILDQITGALPDVSYDRLCSPHLRPSTIVGPKRAEKSPGAA